MRRKSLKFANVEYKCSENTVRLVFSSVAFEGVKCSCKKKDEHFMRN